jgi:aspartyl/asparaginyl beta-hydroxylase (cupin superfamily)
VIVPGNCRFRVGNETRDWEEGKAWVFDDTIDHEAWNDSDGKRVIVMIDIWNPMLTPAERDLVSGLLNGMRDYYDS